MAQPFVWMSTYQANPGTLDEYKEFCQRVVDLVEKEEPDMLYFNFFLNEDTNEVTVLQVHRTVENMSVHMNLIAPLLAESRDKGYFDNATLRTRVLGTPTEAIRGQMEQMAGAGCGPDAQPRNDQDGSERIERAGLLDRVVQQLM